ncbi:MAG: hypothetical protein LBC61_02235 [Candidatus Peribacteria bacterium]|jgi:hypothetical protein|nr:hypothetical protein [Candidatus Peribacteria bacterium]
MVTFTEPVVKIDPRLLKKHSLEEIQAIVNLYFKDEFKTDDDFVEF